MKLFFRIFFGFILTFAAASSYASQTFTARFAGQQTVDGENSIAVTFSHPLDSKQNINTYLSLFLDDDTAVEGAWVLSDDPQVVYFANITADTEYKIQIHKGLKSKSGEKLADPQDFAVRTRAVVPMISFGSKGFILPSRLNRGLPVDALNIDKADIDFFRVKPESVSRFARHFGLYDKMSTYMNKQLHQFADLVYSGRWDLEIKKNIRTSVNIPITHIKALSEPGIYFAVIKGAGQYNYVYSSTWFSISDIGLHVRHYTNLLQCQVQSLETAKPLKGVTIEGYAKKSEKIFEAKTDQSGIAKISTATKDIDYLIARSGKSITFLPMEVPVLDLSEFRTAVEPFRPIDLFVYGPRDLYRPGETVVLDGLLRNCDGQMTANLPLSAEIIRPDGRVIHEFLWKGQNFNHYHYEYDLPSDAITGKWRISFKHGADRLKDYGFTVADFMPERMKLDLSNPKNQADILSPDMNPALSLQGDFLYGAPAAGVRANAMIHVRPARKLFKDTWPGYEFGDATDDTRLSFETQSIKLDPSGKGLIKIRNEWQDTDSPLWITANASIYDSGGRPVVRNKSWQIWPAEQLVGIRLLSKDHTVENNSTAEFEVIAVDKSGKRIRADHLDATVIREHREYYWEFRHETWQWHYTSQFYPVENFKVDVSENGAAKVRVPVKWGGYRLEIKNPATGIVSSYRIQAGWHMDGGPSDSGVNRPDRVVLTLDKPRYKAGDTARVFIKAPEAGMGYVFVETDTNLVTLPVKLPEQGTHVDIDILPTWARHDLYISAIIIKKGSSRNLKLPKRAVGLVHLPLDREGRKLYLTSDLPKKTEPNKTLTLNFNVAQPDGTKPREAYVTLALVDVGVLNLTGFQTPSPFDYFFQPRKYSVQMHDIYQKLIEAGKGPWAKQRFGGDMAALSRGGDKPATDVQIVSITQNAVKTDENGHVSFNVNIPDFNGQVRVMAVAHTGFSYGSFEQEMTIAAPVVTQITMPRFLSMGDKSGLAINVHNLTDTPQVLNTRIQITGPITLLNDADREITLQPKDKTTLFYDIFAKQQLGRSVIRFTADGIVVETQPKRIDRQWYLETRPAWPAWSKISRTRLKPGEVFEISSKEMTPLIRETVSVQAALGSLPPINVAEHIRKLVAYPYGCLEQTTSGIFPFVILSSNDLSSLGLKGDTDADTGKKVSLGIQRLMEKQKTTGGFGLWSAKAKESYWLTAYAADFLIHAKQAGYPVPDLGLKRLLRRLQTYVKRAATVRPEYYMTQKHYRAACRAYAAFVLSRVQAIPLGDTRSLYQSIEKDLLGALGLVQMGLALKLSGDELLGRQAIEKALANALSTSRKAQFYYGDYGSDVRDLAMAYFLVANFYPQFNDAPLFLEKLTEKLQRRSWLSTQERNALVLAGSVALKNKGKLWQAKIGTQARQFDLSGTRQKQIISLKGEAFDGFKIENNGNSDLYLTTALSGYPVERPQKESNGIRISRRYLTLNGDGFNAANLKSGDRMLVELSFRAEKRLPNALIVDLLPAGLEAEDPNLAGSTAINEIVVDRKTVGQWHQKAMVSHTEYRDDRFATALHIPAKTDLRIFYPVRVVSPGEFLVPPPQAEDMYQPSIRAVGDSLDLMRVARP